MKKLKLYKVLNDDLISPYQGFKFEIGKTYHCENFDESNSECSRGFYAVDIDGLPYAFNTNRIIYNVTVWGKSKVFDEFKRRYEYMRIDGVTDMNKLIENAKKLEPKLGYKISNVLRPLNPQEITPVKVGVDEILLLQKWASVWDSVWASVWASVWDSVRASVGALFTGIKKWKYIDHKEGEYPFQPCVDLYKKGLLPSFDGETWRLHTGKEAKVVFEITKEELIKYKG